MPIRMRLFMFLIGIFLFVLIVDLVRRRKIKEEYSLLWLISGVVICILSLWFEIVEWIAAIVGTVYPPSILFLFGIIFLAVINIYYSIKISELSNQVKNLSQKIAIMGAKKEKGNLKED